MNRLLHTAVALAFAVAQPVAAAEAHRSFIVHDEPQSIPDVQFTDENGQELSLSGLQGKVVLLNIWATWCAPCREEMPSLDRLQRRLGGEGLEVVALSIDSGAEGLPKIRSFFAAVGVSGLKVYNDPGSSAGYCLD